MTTQAITMHEVDSSQIYAVGHDPETNTLAVRFKSKDGLPTTLYHYANFTEADFEAFLCAESIGSYFYRNIKPFPDKYPYTKQVEAETEA